MAMDTPPICLPTAGMAEFVAALARRHGVAYAPISMDAWAHKVTDLADEAVKLDATELLLLALVRANIISGREMGLLTLRHLHEKDALR